MVRLQIGNYTHFTQSIVTISIKLSKSNGIHVFVSDFIELTIPNYQIINDNKTANYIVEENTV